MASSAFPALLMVGLPCIAGCVSVLGFWRSEPPKHLNYEYKEEQPNFINWSNLVMQSTDSSCGAAVIATLTAWRGTPIAEQELIRSARITPIGMSLLDFANLASQVNLQGRWLEGTFGQMQKLQLPVVAFIDEPLGHFVIVKQIYGNHVLVADPYQGNVVYSPKTFKDVWSGMVYAFL